MKVIDLNDKHLEMFLICLEDWSEAMKNSGYKKREWYEKMKDKGLKVKLVLDDNDALAGFIQYLPIEHSYVEGKDLYFATCIWIHGHTAGVGNLQGKGMGKALLKAAEEEVKALGANGLVCWGISGPYWMRADWFQKHGYEPVDQDDWAVLLWKPFSSDAVPPRWIKQKKNPPLYPGKVTVSAFVNGWCPAQNINYEHTKKAVTQFGDKIVFHEYDTTDRETLLEWGIADAIYINEENITTGPPLSYEHIFGKIAEYVMKLNP